MFRTLTIALFVWLAACGPPPSGAGLEPVADPLAEADPEKLFMQGRQLAQVGDLIRAEQYLVAAMEGGHPAAVCLPLLVEVCVQGNRFDTALHHIKPHLQQDPDNWRLRYLVATLYHAVGRDLQAEQELRRVLALHPGNEDSHFTLATILWERGQRQKAGMHLREYLQLAPEGSLASDARSMLREAGLAGASPAPIKVPPPPAGATEEVQEETP